MFVALIQYRDIILKEREKCSQGGGGGDGVAIATGIVSGVAVVVVGRRLRVKLLDYKVTVHILHTVRDRGLHREGIL